jgi:hypothetical protein
MVMNMGGIMRMMIPLRRAWMKRAVALAAWV